MNLRDFVESSKPATLDHRGDYTKVRCLNSFTLWVYNYDDSLTPCLLKDGYWESWITAWMISNIKPGMNFMDIGAHCGYYTFLANYLGASVTAYEPNPTYYDSISWSIMDNDADVDFRPVAVSNYWGTATLSYPNASSGSASIVDSFNEHEVKVTKTWLTGEFNDDITVPDILKIDAEGAELDIWEGAHLQSLEKKPVVTVEFFPAQSRYQELLEKLKTYGEVYLLGFDGNEYSYSNDAGRLVGDDWMTLVVRPH